MGFSRQEYWSGVPFPPPGDLPNPGTELASPALQVGSLPRSHREALVSITFALFSEDTPTGCRLGWDSGFPGDQTLLVTVQWVGTRGSGGSNDRASCWFTYPTRFLSLLTCVLPVRMVGSVGEARHTRAPCLTGWVAVRRQESTVRVGRKRASPLLCSRSGGGGKRPL